MTLGKRMSLPLTPLQAATQMAAGLELVEAIGSLKLRKHVELFGVV